MRSEGAKENGLYEVCASLEEKIVVWYIRSNMRNALFNILDKPKNPRSSQYFAHRQITWQQRAGQEKKEKSKQKKREGFTRSISVL